MIFLPSSLSENAHDVHRKYGVTRINKICLLFSIIQSNRQLPILLYYYFFFFSFFFSIIHQFSRLENFYPFYLEIATNMNNTTLLAIRCMTNILVLNFFFFFFSVSWRVLLHIISSHLRHNLGKRF